MLALSRGAARAAVDDAEDAVYSAVWQWADAQAEYTAETAGRLAQAARRYAAKLFDVTEAD